MPQVQFSEEVEEQEPDPYDSGLRAEEANQFDSVCDGVINCLAYLHEANQEFLDFKNELMEHLLPSSVLLRLSLVSGNIYRSISDLNVPLNELLRMVRVYSGPWEEKSEALKKLHEDYSKKTAQLNVALQKLANQEFEANRIKKERRLLNWEKLFTRVELCKGHGRRWKFRMHDFREKAEQGREHLSAYFKMGEDQKSDEADLSKFHIPKTKTLVGDVSESEEEEETELGNQSRAKSFSPAKVRSAKREPLKVKEVQVDNLPAAPSPEPPPDTNDACVWTNEPVFDQTLHLRLYNPEMINQSDLSAVLYFGENFYKLNNIDKPTEIETISRSSTSLSSQSKKGGLIGSKSKTEQSFVKTVKYKEACIAIPAEVLSGALQNPEFTSIHIKILKEGSHIPLAVSTIDMDDLKNLELPSVKCAQEELTDTNTLPRLEPLNFPLYPHNENAATVNDSIGEIPIALYWEKRLVSGTVDKDTETVSINDLVLDMTGVDLNVMSKGDIVLRKEAEDKNISPRPQTPLPESVLKSVFDDMLEQKQNEIDFMQQQYGLRLQELETTIAENVPPSTESRANSPHRRVYPSPPPRYSASMQTSPVKERPPDDHRSKRGSLISRTPDSGGKRSKTPDGRKSKMSVTGRPASEHSEVRFTGDTLESKDDSEQPDAPIPHNTPATENVGPMLSKTVCCKQSKPNRKSDLPQDPFERMALLDDQAQKHKEEYVRRARAEEAKEIELALTQSYKMDRNWDRNRVSLDANVTSADGVESALRDVTLPALFSQQRNAAGTLFNPRARQYFHPVGMKNIRLTQPPSMVALPPIKNEISVLNLFAIADHIRNRHYLDPYGTGSGGGQQPPDDTNPVGNQPTAFITENN